MKIQILVWIYSIIIILPAIIRCHTITTNVVHVQAKNPWTNGFWQKKVIWKPRWVKSWEQKKIYVGIWKKVWGPVLLNEWVPLPKPPSGWIPKH